MPSSGSSTRVLFDRDLDLERPTTREVRFGFVVGAVCGSAEGSGSGCVIDSGVEVGSEVVRVEEAIKGNAFDEVVENASDGSTVEGGRVRVLRGLRRSLGSGSGSIKVLRYFQLRRLKR
jgi:hypothetical protein